MVDRDIVAVIPSSKFCAILGVTNRGYTLGYTESQSVSGLKQISPLLFDVQTRFLQVRALAEASKGDRASLREIELLSKHALATLDYALFAVDHLQAELPLTSVSAAAAAQDVAHELWQLSKTYNVELELDVTKRLEPVYANESALKGALFGLVSSVIIGQQQQGKKRRFVIAAQQTAPKTQRLGVYAKDELISAATLRQVRTLAGRARSAAPAELNNSGLGLVVSDQLTQALGSELQRFTHRSQKGIGFYVPMSAQLSLL